jgi:hypothetical protein
MRATLSGVGALASGWAVSPASSLWAQTLEELESDFKVARGFEQGGEPVLSLFTVVLLAALLVVVGGIILGLGAVERRREHVVAGDFEGEGDSYSLNIAFLATGYVCIILMLAFLPPTLGAGLGAATRWVLITAAVFISIAHLLAARDERTLPPYLKYLFSGSVVLAALFFHLIFKQWSFLRFSDPFYRSKVPFVALGLIILLVLAYSAYITWEHYHRGRPQRPAGSPPAGVPRPAGQRRPHQATSRQSSRRR